MLNEPKVQGSDTTGMPKELLLVTKKIKNYVVNY